MKRFVEGVDRGQSTLFPECLEDWVDENNPEKRFHTAKTLSDGLLCHFVATQRDR